MRPFTVLIDILSGLLASAALTASSTGNFPGQAKARPWRGWAHAATLARGDRPRRA